MSLEEARADAGILHVVLGTGPLGLALLRHLAAGGQRVRAVAGHGRDDLPEGVEFLGANLADASEAERACDGADVVYHCANPPYAKWPELHPPLMHAIIDGASSASAKLVFGDNLYAYGPVDGVMTEDLPYRAPGPNGRTRAWIAKDLMTAHEQGRVRATIGRGSDFFGPFAHQSTVGEQIFARALEGKPAQLLGDPTPRTPSPTSTTSPARWRRSVRGTRRWARSGTSPTPKPSPCAASWRWHSKGPVASPDCGRHHDGVSRSRACSTPPSGQSENSSTSRCARGWSTAASSNRPSAGAPHRCRRRSGPPRAGSEGEPRLLPDPHARTQLSEPASPGAPSGGHDRRDRR